MSYLVLARKYRPRTFEQVAGQEVPVRVLQGALQEGRIGHAYLFSGPRGTGKTTTARIFAKALNCEQGPTPTPCDACERCRASDAGVELDVIEIDAASNRGVEEARSLREEVAYAPMKARFKVYIVDEVHMLTGPAFNTLLKTLEEPPAHVKFLFATTELHKVIETVRSRCQVVRMNLIREEVIAQQLERILAREGVRPGAGVTAELARLARGSMRDALSLTDQLLALVGEAPQLEDVQRLGGQGLERLDALLERVEAGDRAGVLRALPRETGGEADLLSGLLDHLRGALIALLCPDEAALSEADPAERERRAARARRLGPERLQLWLEELLLARERMQGLEQHARVVLELTLLELCAPAAGVPLAELEQRLVELEGRLGGAPRAAATAPAAAAPRAGSPTVQERGELKPAPPRKAQASAPQRREEQASSPAAAGAPAGTAVLEAQAPPVPSAPPAPQRPPHAARLTGVALEASTDAAWRALLAGLAAEGEEPARLAELLGRRGRLADLGPSRAVVQLARLSEPERERLLAPHVRLRCERVLAELVGHGLELTLEDLARRRPGREDPFTRGVAELFGGQIED